MLWILAYSLAQGHLLLLYLRAGKEKASSPVLPVTLPKVTVQLPLYNEPLVAERLLLKISQMDWPGHLLEIQVLDDSTDGTTGIVQQTVERLRAGGIDIAHIRRSERKGFKAGALAHGLTLAKGEFIAIFDADFLPEPDFLRQTIGHFAHPEVGAVQVRWGHLNRNYNLLTRLLAMTLDAHFTIEQRGRGAGGNFINFNGTAGVWRKSCIEDAGGWSADTLTEDLDLSYRAQLKGWRIAYVEDYSAPAEIPMLMPAIRSQQYRWNKGGAEVARKLLGRVLTSAAPLHTKLHAVFHLLNTSVFPCVLTAALISVPLTGILAGHPLRSLLLTAGMFLFSGFAVFAGAHFVSVRQSVPQGTSAMGTFITQFPLFLCMSMGLSLFNSIAVLEGYMGRRTPFVRTPKFASTDQTVSRRMVRWGIPPPVALAEGLLALYFAFGAALAIHHGYHLFLLFHLMLTTGFGLLFIYSAKHARMA